MGKKELFQAWLKAKKAEDQAREKRHTFELEIEALYPDFDGQSKTFKEDELGYSVNVKRNVSYKMNQERWQAVRVEIPEHLRPEKIKFDVDVKGFEYLKSSQDPEEIEIYKKISDCVTVTPGKTSIKVEKI